MSVISNVKIAKCASSWAGVPFIKNGKARSGCDCVGMLSGVLKECHIYEELTSVLDKIDYGNYIDGNKFIHIFDKYTNRIKLSDVCLGDIVVLGWKKNPIHVAIVIGIDPIYIAHAYFPRGKVVTHILDDIWLQKVQFVCRMLL